MNRRAAFAVSVLLLAGCHRATAPDLTEPSAAAGPATQSPPKGPVNAEAMLAENDRIIAQNQRMTAQLAAYSRENPAKLDRLSGDCRRRLGIPADADGARKNFRCIKAGW